MIDLVQLVQLKEELETKRHQRDLVQSQLNNLKEKKRTLKKELIRKERALEFVKDIALKTQSQLQYHLSDMVSTGLNSVFDQEYNFKVIFEIKRGKTECGLFFEKDGNLVDPINQSGLGAADVAGLCLRFAAWSMSPVYRKTMILDEPLKHLSLNYHEKAAQLIKMLSEKLGLQIIMVTHSEVMSQYSDKVFKVQIKDNVSSVKEIKEI